jgi:ComF family protein
MFAENRLAQLMAADPQVVVPIPLHWRRRWTRGYNQSEAVARALAERLGLPCRPGWLVRIRPTQYQPTVSATARWENVRGAFRVGFRAAVRGVRILLVDDVLTTGATADAAATALTKAGTAQVAVAVLAHR